MSCLKTLLLALLTTTGRAHMVMNLPTPFSPELATTFPLDPPGGRFPFPCTGLAGFASRTRLVPGTTTTVNFTGAAPHGGGSCQFGINYHTNPAGGPYSVDDPSHWKTIYTIIGGCPAVTAGNLEHAPFYRGLDPDGRPDAVHCGGAEGVDCIRQFEVPIPKGLPAGNATFAWVWYNRITAGEVYMTCSPIVVEAEDGDEAFVEELPSMFFANIEGYTNCSTSKTGEQGVFNIPRPGRFGVQLVEPDPQAAGDCEVAPPAVFETQEVPTATATATATVIQPSAGFTTTITVTVTAGNTTPLPSSSGLFNSTRTLTVTAGNTTLSPSSSGFFNSTRTTTASVGTTTTTMAVPSSSGFFTSTPSTPIFLPPSTPSPPPRPADDPKPPCPQPGQLVCLGDKAFAICGPFGVVGAVQHLNPEQMCVDGRVVLRGV